MQENVTRLSIEKGIPIPDPGHWGRMNTREFISIPWAEMEVGDSVFAPTHLASGIKAGAATMAKKLGVKFTTRTVPFGVRVWRTE